MRVAKPASVAPAAPVVPDPAACVRRAVALAVPAGGRVLLAVSGGSDSVALLAAAREGLDQDLLVAHVRHGLRADDGRDAGFTEALCGEAGLPCRVLRAGPVAAGGGRTETAARRRRLAVLARTAEEAGCDAVLAAHHADDVRETAVLHLLRGHRGERALAGIPAVRRLGARCVLVRPFVVGDRPPERAVLARYREACGLPCVQDPTNADTSIARNAVRAMLAADDGGLRDRLDAARGVARRRLRERVLGAAVALERGLRREGLGARVERCAFDVDGPQEAQRAHRAEVLRLLGACLARPRRADPRQAVLAALDKALAAGRPARRIRLRVPASSGGMVLECTAHAVHLPGSQLAPGDITALVLAAVSAGSLHL